MVKHWAFLIRKTNFINWVSLKRNFLAKKSIRCDIARMLLYYLSKFNEHYLKKKESWKQKTCFSLITKQWTGWLVNQKTGTITQWKLNEKKDSFFLSFKEWVWLHMCATIRTMHRYLLCAIYIRLTSAIVLAYAWKKKFMNEN